MCRIFCLSDSQARIPIAALALPSRACPPSRRPLVTTTVSLSYMEASKVPTTTVRASSKPVNVLEDVADAVRVSRAAKIAQTKGLCSTNLKRTTKIWQVDTPPNVPLSANVSVILAASVAVNFGLEIEFLIRWEIEITGAFRCGALGVILFFSLVSHDI